MRAAFDRNREGAGLAGPPSSPTRASQALAILAPLVLALVLMIPRLVSPQFGLLDDGNSLHTARLLAAGQWHLGDVAAGRSRPLYWLFWSLPYLIAGPNPVVYFLANLVSLIVLGTCVIGLSRALKMGLLPTSLGATLFLLTGPVVENFYTLSKGEPLQLILIVLALVVALRDSRGQRFSMSLAVWLIMSVLTFLAGITKETVLVMVPISLGWLVAARLRSSTQGRIDRSTIQTAFVGFSIGAACFLVYRALSVGPEILGSGYASAFEFSKARILDSGSRWLAWLSRDFAYVLPLSLMPLFWRRAHQRPGRIDIILGTLIWMAGWLAIFLPWLFVAEYYLLPFSLGAALFASILVDDALGIMKRKASARMATIVLLALAGGLFCTNLINLSTTARLQLAVDEANAEMVSFLATEVPQGGTVLVNIQDPTEYVSQIRLHLAELYDRGDIRVTPLALDGLSQTDLGGDVFIASPYIENQVLLSDRLGVYEPNVREWNASIAEFVKSHSVDRASVRRQVRGLSFDPARAICPLFAGAGRSSPTTGLPVESILNYCRGGRLVDRRTFSYGWDIYALDLE